MTTLPQTVTCQVSFRRPARRHRDMPPSQVESVPEVPPGRVPRIARLMALALRFEQLLQAGVVTDYAELARLGHVSRARVSQIMNLLVLAPAIQEALLFLPPTLSGRDPIHLRQLLALAAVRDWREQRALWQALQERAAAK
jgi:hypothetical protein